MNEIDIVRDISRKLNGAGFPFMLTGSMAMNYYAVPRMTRDIDVVIAITANDVRRIAGLFEADYYISEQSVKESVARQSMFNLIHLDSVIRLTALCAKAASIGGLSSTGGKRSKSWISQRGS